MKRKLLFLFLIPFLCFGITNLAAANYDMEIDIDLEESNIILSSADGANFRVYGSGVQSTYSITIAENSGDINLTIENVNIKSTASSILVNTGSSLNILLEGENKLESSDGCAIEAKGAITIDGKGSLNAIARGWGDAAIGTRNDGPDMPNMTFNGGTISATSYSESPGIGSRAKLVGTITINGGILTVNCAHYSAAIGSGYTATGSSEIIINGGTITAKTGAASSGAAIGRGHGGAGVGKVTINGGSIKTLANSGSINNTNGVQPAPKNSSEVALSFKQVSGNTASEYITEGTIGSTILGSNYGIKDMMTDATGSIYLYLPEADANATPNGIETSPDNPNDIFVEIDITEFRNMINGTLTQLSSAVVGEQIGEYYQSSLDAFETAVNKAISTASTGTALKKDEIALQEAIDAFTNSKNTAIEDIADVLADAITSAQAILTANSPGGNEAGQYPVAAVNTFSAAITTAQGGSDRAALDALTAARKNFLNQLIPVNLAELEQAITDAKTEIAGKEEGDYNGQYPVGSIATFQAAIDAAEAMKDFPPTTQAPVDNMKNDLLAAMDVFKNSVVDIDAGDLIELVTKAEDYATSINAEAGSNLSTALNTFNGVISEARETSESEEVTEADINDTVTLLNNAIKAFITTLKAEEGLTSLLLNKTTAYITNTPNDITEFQSILSALGTLLEDANEMMPSEDMDIVTQVALQTTVDGLNENLSDLFTLMSADLKALVEEAQPIYANMQVGTGDGEYTEQEKSALNAAINSANSKLNPNANTQYDYFILEVETLTNALNSILGGNLLALITKVESALENANEGTGIGQYPEGSKAELNAVLTPAKEAAETGTETGFESFYGDAYNALKTAYDEFKDKVITIDAIDYFSENGISIFSIDGKLYILGVNENAVISGYDINGRLVFNGSINGQDYSKELSSGSYIILLNGYSKIVVVK